MSLVSHAVLFLALSWLYLLFEVQQGLPVGLQHGVQPRAESPQVNPMKPGLAGLAAVMLLHSRDVLLNNETVSKTQSKRKKIIAYKYFRTHLWMNMSRVLFYKLCKAYIIWAQFTESVEDTGLTGVKEGQVLGHLKVTWKTSYVCLRNA